MNSNHTWDELLGMIIVFNLGEEIMFRTDLLDQPSILDEYSKVSGVMGLKCKMCNCNCIMIGYVLRSPRAFYA